MTMTKGYLLRVLWEIWGKKVLFKKTRAQREVDIFDSHRSQYLWKTLVKKTLQFAPF